MIISDNLGSCRISCHYINSVFPSVSCKESMIFDHLYLLKWVIPGSLVNIPCLGGFHLHLLVFPFDHLPVQFKKRLKSVHHLQMTSSVGFQNHFTIISKFVCCGCYMKKNVAFILISFAILK